MAKRSLSRNQRMVATTQGAHSRGGVRVSMSPLLLSLAARTWAEVTGGKGVALDAQGREIPPAQPVGDVSADDEGQS